MIPGFTFDPKDHIYRYLGKRVWSNTQLLNEYKLIDFTNVPEARLFYKQQLGTAVHYACHLLVNTNLDEASLDKCDETLKAICPGEHKSIKGYIDAFRKFCEVTGFEARHSELPLYSKRFGFATTLDLQGPFVWQGKERESIIELKCTWELMPSNRPQTAGQEIAFNENYPKIKNKSRFGLKLKEDSCYDIIEYNSPRDKQVFLACLEIHRFREENGLVKDA